jgi:hypothetical protein
MESEIFGPLVVQGPPELRTTTLNMTCTFCPLVVAAEKLFVMLTLGGPMVGEGFGSVVHCRHIRHPSLLPKLPLASFPWKGMTLPVMGS